MRFRDKAHDEKFNNHNDNYNLIFLNYSWILQLNDRTILKISSKFYIFIMKTKIM